MAKYNRKIAEKRGRRAELYARLWLRLKGYKILKNRFKTKVGEIDIIAKKGNTLAIVEVKARQSIEVALQSISYKQKRRIERCTELWLKNSKASDYISPRFDLIAIVPNRFPIHIKQAWRLGE
ncbi:YraN family protein [Kordiimonas sp. SCSIO 12610]|uniref:YraN family protein n=1 Tax=Kordiimonas sp. SCSIO 12610 TaxID=2829597 RepID=UPI002109E817|nr:YraN family protein [Kordiimonas sp. SCSIO 12610]UTW55482.1 YraN family protein [Kordiimonas sp. SCSIO 12610]